MSDSTMVYPGVPPVPQPSFSTWIDDKPSPTWRHRVIIWSLWMAALLVAFALIGGIVGFLAYRTDPTGVMGYISNLQTEFQNMNLASPDGSGGMQINLVPLFFHNLSVGMFMVAFSFIPFLFVPAQMIALNGLVLGLLGGVYGGIGIPGFYFLGVLPHGIFELTALIIASGMGCVCALDFIRMILGKPDAKARFKATWKKTLVWFWVTVVPLLAIAALIETYVTPALIGA